VKNDVDIFLMLEPMDFEEQRVLAERLYSDAEIRFEGLDLFLNFPTDGRRLINWETEGIIFESETTYWQEGVDYQLLWKRVEKGEDEDLQKDAKGHHQDCSEAEVGHRS